MTLGGPSNECCIDLPRRTVTHRFGSKCIVLLAASAARRRCFKGPPPSRAELTVSGTGCPGPSRSVRRGRTLDGDMDPEAKFGRIELRPERVLGWVLRGLERSGPIEGGRALLGIVQSPALP